MILRVEHEGCGWGEAGVFQSLSDACVIVPFLFKAEAKARGQDSRADHQHRQAFVPCTVY